MQSPGRASALISLLRAAGGQPDDVVRRALVLACELLDMDLAYLTTLDHGATPPTRTVVRAVARDGQDVPEALGLTEPLEQSWLVGDSAEHPELMALLSTAAIASRAGVAVLGPDGAVGTLCVLGHRPQESLNERDLALLRDLAVVVAPLVPVLDGLHLPLPRSTPDPSGLDAAVLTADSVEGLTRPLLETLQQLTSLGSTYLTQIHGDTSEQEIAYSLNTRPGFVLPEGLRVPWADTLCKRALEQGRVCTTDVPEVWGDSEAAATLGIQVYVSVPVELPDGQVWGTLCAADSRPAEQLEAHLPTMRMFSRLIAAEVARSQRITSHLTRSVRSAERALLIADTDALTGATQRRLVEPWLTTALATAPEESEVVVAFLDVDDFKLVNDTLGHSAGDAVLVELARRLRRGLRQVDLLARYGGDEFLVAAVLPAEGMPYLARRLHELELFTTRVNDVELDVRVSVGIASQPAGTGADVDPDELIARADQAMYAVKRSRSRR